VNGLCCLLVAAAACVSCGPDTWSFDPDAGADHPDGAAVEDVGVRDAVSANDDADLDLENGFDPPDDSGTDVAAVVPDVATPCSVDGDCPGGAPHCNQSGICDRCRSAADCASDAGARICNASSGACVECISSADCSVTTMRPYCDTAADRCVQCLSDTNCGFESICLAAHTCTKMY
jgi:hypothetical protein